MPASLQPRRILSEIIFWLAYPWVRLFQAWDDWIESLNVVEDH